MFKRTLCVFGSFFLMMGAVAQTSVILGADKAGGSYFLYGGGISTWMNKHSKDMRVTSETTRGSVENVRLMDSGRIDFGLVNGVVTYQARHGSGQFEGHATEKLRGVALLDEAPLHIVTLQSLGIKSFEDLADKRVSVGGPGSGTANAANSLFKLADLNKKVNVQYLGYDESSSNLRDGNLASFFVASALPAPSVVNLAGSRDIELVSISDDLFKKLHAETPSYQQIVIPAGTYSGIDKDVKTVGMPSLLLVREGVSDEVVYELVSQLFSEDSIKYMRNVYHGWDIKPGVQVFEDISVPLHPGAERFYREQGLLK